MWFDLWREWNSLSSTFLLNRVRSIYFLVDYAKVCFVCTQLMNSSTLYTSTNLWYSSLKIAGWWSGKFEDNYIWSEWERRHSLNERPILLTSWPPQTSSRFHTGWWRIEHWHYFTKHIEKIFLILPLNLYRIKSRKGFEIIPSIFKTI